jgi:hypothetical protein
MASDGFRQGRKRKNKVRKGAKFEKVSTLPIIRSLVGLGFTAEDIGIVLGVSANTLSSWKQRYPEIYEANKEGKQILKGLICAEMIRCALGYDYDEIDEEYLVNEDGEIVLQPDGSKVKKIKSHHKKQQANPDLLKFIANNLMPETFPRTPVQVEANILQIIGDSEPDRLKAFAGRLLELGQETKKVESVEVESRQTDLPDND